MPHCEIIQPLQVLAWGLAHSVLVLAISTSGQVVQHRPPAAACAGGTGVVPQADVKSHEGKFYWTFGFRIEAPEKELELRALIAAYTQRTEQTDSPCEELSEASIRETLGTAWAEARSSGSSGSGQLK